ncbi:hypothetical protein ON010_g18694 [Phytophthora cinnamomi]|nr:hypothetical protein ON010_g18694 [Phytophthora cinnamomi]
MSPKGETPTVPVVPNCEGTTPAQANKHRPNSVIVVVCAKESTYDGIIEFCNTTSSVVQLEGCGFLCRTGRGPFISAIAAPTWKYNSHKEQSSVLGRKAATSQSLTYRSWWTAADRCAEAGCSVRVEGWLSTSNVL